MMFTTLARQGTRGMLWSYGNDNQTSLAFTDNLAVTVTASQASLHGMTQPLDGGCRTQQGEGGDEQPEFLPMFPWYSGESMHHQFIITSWHCKV